MASVEDYEKLGSFYLGRLWDEAAAAVTAAPLLYDAKDLTTHAVCVGMTGSGKTGLSIGLLEEALIDGIPVLAIDPKGDLGNLLLSFPELRPEDFRPWIDPAEAERAGRSPAEHAAATAERWRNGLAEWGQSGERIGRLASAGERVLYTPGSRAGRPLALLRSLSAPPDALLADDDAFRDRVTATTASLLGLLGVEGDPLRSREHILVASLLDRAWREHASLDLAGLIQGIRKPPFERVGVVDLESFFPEKERFELAMTLNNLLASPGFDVWLAGDPLDVSQLLYASDGRPRLSVVSIAHLDDRERMFVVSTLLNEVVAWTRSRPGSTSLAAIVYMDEVAGYLPPVANPPSKAPMLTLLKQARAFGVGVVLATQNPVDLDYKALSNAGTWFLGRLQTERDKQRVLDGLTSSAAGATVDRAELERRLSGLPSRVFLMHDVHEDGPVLFQTRWTLSYLAGPLTREQIRGLATARGSSDATTSASAAPSAAPCVSAPSGQDATTAGARPAVPPGVPEVFLRIDGATRPDERIVYRAALLGRANVHLAKAAVQVDEWRPVALLGDAAARDESPWNERRAAAIAVDEAPAAGGLFADLPPGAGDPKVHRRWRDQLVAHLVRTEDVTLYRSAAPKLTSQPAESEGAFRGRILAKLREERDVEKEAIRARYAAKVARTRDKVERAEHGVEREKSQFRDRGVQTAISVGASVVGALFGRRLGTTTVLREASRTARERGDVSRAEERAESARRELDEIEAELEEKVAALAALPDPATLAVEPVRVTPKKSDVTVELVAIAWCPWREGPSGIAPAFATLAFATPTPSNAPPSSGSSAAST